MAKKENLLLLFDRPQEPVFVEKGPKNAVFDVPSEFLTDRFKDIGIDIQNKFSETAGERIPVQDNFPISDIRLPISLGRHEQFSLFIPRHRQLAAKLIEAFMSKKQGRHDLIEYIILNISTSDLFQSQKPLTSYKQWLFMLEIE